MLCNLGSCLHVFCTCFICIWYMFCFGLLLTKSFSCLAWYFRHTLTALDEPSSFPYFFVFLLFYFPLPGLFLVLNASVLRWALDEPYKLSQVFLTFPSFSLLPFWDLILALNAKALRCLELRCGVHAWLSTLMLSAASLTVSWAEFAKTILPTPFFPFLPPPLSPLVAAATPHVPSSPSPNLLPHLPHLVLLFPFSSPFPSLLPLRGTSPIFSFIFGHDHDMVACRFFSLGM